MKKLFPLFLAVSLLVMTISGCSLGSRPSANEADKGVYENLKVYTTFYPLYDFALKIAGDKVLVENIMPTGAEPHEFEPTPRVIAELYDAGVFVFLGEPMDPWAKKIQKQLESKGVVVVEAGKGLIQNDDPHIWLDPVLAKQIARRIFDALVKADTGHEDYYEANLLKLEQRLDELDEKYKNTLSQLPKRDIITSHDFLGYMARRYALNPISITGLSPQDEPSGKKLAEIATLARTRGIKAIFSETLASPKFAETIAREVGAKTLVLNPAAGLTPEEEKAGEDYFSIMEKNLEALKTALSE